MARVSRKHKKQKTSKTQDATLRDLLVVAVALIFSVSFAGTSLSYRYADEVKESFELFDVSNDFYEFGKFYENMKPGLALLDFSDQAQELVNLQNSVRNTFAPAMVLFDASSLVIADQGRVAGHSVQASGYHCKILPAAYVR